MNITPVQLAKRFIGVVKERPGNADDPLILAMLQMCDPSAQHDEVPWCSAFVNFVAWLLDLPRSKSLSARSWLRIGTAIPGLGEAQAYADVVILSRGVGPQPPAEIIAAPGHVGWYLSHNSQMVTLLGGNQGNTVSAEDFPLTRILGIRRLWTL